LSSASTSYHYRLSKLPQSLSPLFFLTATAPTAIYTLSLHDALPISFSSTAAASAIRTTLRLSTLQPIVATCRDPKHLQSGRRPADRKSTRLNSSHVAISYAVFCLKKKKKKNKKRRTQTK